VGILDQTRFVERLQFFNGQRLFASDLQGIDEFNREMRWLHNQSLHQPGIGNGFAVYGKKGDREVTINPGYAIDDLGREIVLTQPQVVSVPPVASEDDGQSVFYDLTVSYPDDSELEEAETREGICLPRGVVRLREAPVFCWVRLERDDQGNLHAKNGQLGNDIKTGRKLALARAEVLNCQLRQDLSIAQRRSARPSKQPYIACGRVQPVWQAWPVNLAGAQFNVGLTATIDASSAGFVTTPCYNARIDGPRPGTLQQQQGGGVFVMAARAEVNILGVFFTDASVYIENDTSDSFEVYVVVIPPSQELQKSFDEVIAWANQNWSVVWMGIEG
jgi:hypothetical protein